MKRKLPLCAWCGKPLARKGRILLEYDDLPGRPAVGWHAGKSGDCANSDPCLQAMVSAFDNDGEINAFDVIEERGPGRITRTERKSR